MSSKRKGEALTERSRFRTERVVRDGSEWCFLTREGTVEGPFGTREAAEEHLETYIRLAIYDMLTEGSNLTLCD